MLRITSSKKDLTTIEHKCKIKLLTNDGLEYEFNGNQLGQQLFEFVASTLQLVDKEYYGLKFAGQNQWLDLSKSIYKQTKGVESINFELKFKFYPADPSILNQEMTRYFLFLQLRIDLQEGRLHCQSQDELAQIIACILQSELGDHDEKFHQLNYVSQFKLVANQTPELERAAAIAHQSDDLRGLSSSEAEHHFLKRVIRLDSYGIDPFSVTDYSCSNDHYKIGVNHTGIITFQDNKKIQHFLWEEVRKISLDGRTIILHTFRPNKDKKKSTALFGFKCESSISCHNLWKLATEHRYFFTIESSDQVPAVTNAGGLFNRSCKLRYTGKVERELLRDPSNRIAERVPIKRTRSLILRGVNERSEWGGGKLASLEESGYDEEGECHGVNRTLPSSMNYAEENSSSDERRTLPTEFNLKPNISPIHENRNSNQFVNNQPKRRNLTKTKDQQRKILVAKRNPSLKGSTLKSLMSDAIVYTVVIVLILIALLVVVNEVDHSSLYSIRANSHMIKVRSYYLLAKKALFDAGANILSSFDSMYY